MTILHGILLLLLGALVLLGICWALLRWEKNRIRIHEYDERQSIERGNAYKISFWVGIVYYLVVVTLGAFDGGTDDLHFLVMLGILIQLLVFSFCCLLTNAELPLSRNPIAAIASYFLIGACDIAYVFLGDVYTLGSKIDKLGSVEWIELICGIGLIMMGLMQLIQLLRREKE